MAPPRLTFYKIVLLLFVCTFTSAQQVNSLKILEDIDYALLKSEPQHLINIKAVTLADSILNTELKDIIEQVQPHLFMVYLDTAYKGCNVVYDSKFGDLSIRFNSAFKATQPFDYIRIPCYVYKDSCKFITENEAIAIAKKAFKQQGGVDRKPTLEFDAEQKKYVYRVLQYLEKRKPPVAEKIIIDPETGKIISQEVYSYQTFRNGVGTEIADEDERDPDPVKQYVKYITNQNKKGNLKKVTYPDMSGCWGALDGYYLKDKLVLMEATYKAELGYSTRTYYLKDGSYVAILYYLHTAEWDAYFKKYPSDKYPLNPEKMTYNDITYNFALPVKVTLQKTEHGETISTEVDHKLLQELIDCGNTMKAELSAIK